MLHDEGLALCIALEPEAFGYLPEKKDTDFLKNNRFPRFVLSDQVSILSQQQISLEKRTCKAYFYLNKEEHLADPIKARDVLRKLVSCDALEFNFLEEQDYDFDF
jgi:hypothetical protein